MRLMNSVLSQTVSMHFWAFAAIVLKVLMMDDGCIRNGNQKGNLCALKCIVKHSQNTSGSRVGGSFESILNDF